MLLHQKGLFNKQETQKIISYANKLEDRVIGTYHPDINDGQHDPDGGHNLADHIAWNSSDEYNWMSHRIIEWLKTLNLKNKVNNLGYEFILQKYLKGFEFKPHIDHVLSRDKKSILRERKYTILMQLSDEKDYSGGGLFVDSNGTNQINRALGNVCIFGPAQLHWVEKITEGERWSCTIFLEKDALTKSLI
jgi:hypothetical protein